MNRIYLSGPMTGIPDYNFPAFHAAANLLRQQGYEVVNPAELPDAGTWEACMRNDVRALCTCDTIALMPGWERSKGANLELHIAHRLGLGVVYISSIMKKREHTGDCATDQSARDVCNAMYMDRMDDNIALCEALRAVYALAGEDPQIAQIVNDAIDKHSVTY